MAKTKHRLLFTSILVIGLILIITLLNVIKVPYSSTEIYTEKEPYDAQESYTQQEPFQDCNTRDYNYEFKIESPPGKWIPLPISNIVKYSELSDQTKAIVKNLENKGGQFILWKEIYVKQGDNFKMIESSPETAPVSQEINGV